MAELNDLHRLELDKKIMTIANLQNKLKEAGELNRLEAERVASELLNKDDELKFLNEYLSEYRLQTRDNFDMMKKDCDAAELRLSGLISENHKL